MTRQVVKDRLRNACDNWARANGYVFHNLINDFEDIDDDVWLSMEFSTDYWEPLCIGLKERREHGTADITVFTRAGTGDSQAMTIADAVEDYFLWATLTDVEIVDTVSASEQNQGDAVSNYYAVTVTIEYRLNLEH